MENKIVCDYCGTIYDAEQPKCPLCGSAHRSEATTLPVQRRRITEEERRERRRAENARQSAARRTDRPAKQSSGEKTERADRTGNKKNRRTRDRNAIPHKLLVAAAVFLALAVLVIFYFIGDMLDWWPGLEDFLRSDQRAQETVYAHDDPSCTYLSINPDVMDFTRAGQTQTLVVAINPSCEEPVRFESTNTAVVRVASSPATSNEMDQTEVSVELTAVGEGQAYVTVSCGTRQMNCTVNCSFTGQTDASEASEPSESSGTALADFTPELNHEDVTMTLPRETLTLRVTNLPDGEEVVWTSSDETVASVDEDGVVTARAPGTATITAQCGGGEAEAIIRCNFEDTAESGYHLELTDVTIAVDETFVLRLYDANGDRVEGASYSSRDTGVCTVDGGEITGVSSGTTRVIVTYAGQSYECIVRVR